MNEPVPEIVLRLLQGLFLLMLYVFVARAVRAVLRDVGHASAPQPAPRPAARAAARPAPVGQPAAAGYAAPPRQTPEPHPRQQRARVEPREIVVHLPSGRPQVVPLSDAEIAFGRGRSCTVTLNDPYVSELHARVYRSDNGWVVADMGSTNGTFLNRQKVTAPTPIVPGDQLGIGKTVVEVRK